MKRLIYMKLKALNPLYIKLRKTILKLLSNDVNQSLIRTDVSNWCLKKSAFFKSNIADTYRADLKISVPRAPTY